MLSEVHEYVNQMHLLSGYDLQVWFQTKCLKHFEWTEMNYVWSVMCNSGKEFMELIMTRTSKKRWTMNTYLFITYFYNFFEKYSRKKNKSGFAPPPPCQCIVVNLRASYVRILEGRGEGVGNG